MTKIEKIKKPRIIVYAALTAAIILVIIIFVVTKNNQKAVTPSTETPVRALGPTMR